MPFLIVSSISRPVSRHVERGDVVLVSSACSLFSHPMRIPCARWFLRSPDSVVLVFPIASSPSHPSRIACRPAPRSRALRFSSLKRRTGIIHPCPAPSHPVISSNSIAPPLSPSHDTVGWAVSLACRLAGRCVSSVLSAYRSAVPRRLARLIAIAHLIGPPCLPAVLGSPVYCACLVSSSCCSRRSHRLIALRPVLSIRRAGSGRCLLRGMVSLCPLDVVSSRLVLVRGSVLAVERRGDCSFALSYPISSLLARPHPMVISSGYAVGCLKNGGGRLPVSFVGM